MVPTAVLVGLPGAGKTTIGKKLAKFLELEFVDIDKVIEKEQQQSIATIFSEQGEDFFRILEKQKIAEYLVSTNGVLSLGAGAIMALDTQLLLRDQQVVYLEISLSEGIKRVSGNSRRPLLKDDPATIYRQLYERRVPIYEKLAKVHIQTRNRPKQQIVEQIARSLGYRHKMNKKL